MFFFFETVSTRKLFFFPSHRQQMNHNNENEETAKLNVADSEHNLQIDVEEEKDFDAATNTKSNPLQALKKMIIDITKGCWILPFIAFGGPQAHTAILMQQFVVQNKWISKSTFLEIFALCSALPGPTSTQMVFAFGIMRGGLLAGFWSFILWS